jgi:hypothetical protein
VHPQRTPIGQVNTPWHNAEYFVAVICAGRVAAGQPNPLPDDCRIATKYTAPEPLGEDCDPVWLGLPFGISRRASRHGPHAQQVEQIRRHAEDVRPFGHAWCYDSSAVCRKPSDVVKARASGLQVSELRNGYSNEIDVRNGPPDSHQAIRFREGQRP